MTVQGILIIAGILSLGIIIIIMRLLRKIEKYEDNIEKDEAYLKELENFIEKQSKAIDVCDRRLKEIDDKQIFRADDEIGWFFEEVKNIQEALNEFRLR